MPCSCGFTTNQDNTCNGNHKIVKLVKDSIIKELDVFFTTNKIELKNEIIQIVKESK